MARVDLSTNELEAQFVTQRHIGGRLLFEEGKRMVEQETIAEQVEPDGYRYLPGDSARVISTDDGRTLAEARLPMVGELSHLFCRGESERFALFSQNEIYLIDAETLTPIASRRLPFERYFVF
jgi:hypothetical protein